jgi:glycosyltransferase involved in cell wall biosynthesis
MQFSIVITTYNRLTWLKRAIASAIAQTVPCEIVVVDNNSSDGTEAYVRSLGQQIVYYRNAANLGHAGAINVGVQLAKGEWIKPVDDDDYLAPTCLEEMSKAIALCPQATLCSCQAAQVDTNGTEISRTRQVGPGWAFYIPQADIHYGMLLELVPFGTPIQVAFRRDAFLQSGGWDTNMTSCDDIDSWIRIAQFGDAIFINQCLAYRTIWPGGYDRKIALQRRLETNILMKERIYALVNDKYRSDIPSIQAIRGYLKLHWGYIALKQKDVFRAFKLVFPAVLSPAAWKLLLNAISSRNQQAENPNLHKLILIKSMVPNATELLSNEI